VARNGCFLPGRRCSRHRLRWQPLRQPRRDHPLSRLLGHVGRVLVRRRPVEPRVFAVSVERSLDACRLDAFARVGSAPALGPELGRHRDRRLARLRIRACAGLRPLEPGLVSHHRSRRRAKSGALHQPGAVSRRTLRRPSSVRARRSAGGGRRCCHSKRARTAAARRGVRERAGESGRVRACSRHSARALSTSSGRFNGLRSCRPSGPRCGVSSRERSRTPR